MAKQALARQRRCPIRGDHFKVVHPKFTRLDSKNPFRLLNNLRLVHVLHLLDIYLDNSLASAFQSLPQLRYLATDVKWSLETIKIIDCSDSVGNSAVMIKQASEEYRSSIQIHILKKDK